MISTNSSAISHSINKACRSNVKRSIFLSDSICADSILLAQAMTKKDSDSGSQGSEPESESYEIERQGLELPKRTDSLSSCSSSSASLHDSISPSSMSVSCSSSSSSSSEEGQGVIGLSDMDLDCSRIPCSDLLLAGCLSSPASPTGDRGRGRFKPSDDT